MHVFLCLFLIREWGSTFPVDASDAKLAIASHPGATRRTDAMGRLDRSGYADALPSINASDTQTATHAIGVANAHARRVDARIVPPGYADALPSIDRRQRTRRQACQRDRNKKLHLRGQSLRQSPPKTPRLRNERCKVGRTLVADTHAEAPRCPLLRQRGRSDVAHGHRLEGYRAKPSLAVETHPVGGRRSPRAAVDTTSVQATEDRWSRQRWDINDYTDILWAIAHLGSALGVGPRQSGTLEHRRRIVRKRRGCNYDAGKDALSTGTPQTA